MGDLIVNGTTFNDEMRIFFGSVPQIKAIQLAMQHPVALGNDSHYDNDDDDGHGECM